MDVKKLLNESKKISKWERVEHGVYDFTVEKVSYEETQQSRKPAIMYYGKIKNSKGEFQDCKVVDIVDKEENFKFGFSRLCQFINFLNLGNTESLESIEQFIDLANQGIGKTLKLEFYTKQVGSLRIKEKMFKFN